MTAEDANRAGETSSDEENGHVWELVPPGERRLWSDIARRGAGQHEHEALLKKLRSILNKLTPTTLHKLAHDITRLDIRTVEQLQAVTFMIHDRAVLADEKIFCGMYASLCDMIKGALPTFQEQPANSSRRHVPGGNDSREIAFKRILVNRCQEEFEGSNRYAHLSGTQVLKARQRMLGNVRFIGHLFLAHMLGESITMNCVQNLLPRSAVDSNGDRIESLCTLLQVCGKELDSLPSCHAAMESVFEQIGRIATLRGENREEARIVYGSRLIFMMQDLIALRDNQNWVPRMIELGPRTLQQIRHQAAWEGVEQRILSIGSVSNANLLPLGVRRMRGPPPSRRH